MGTKDLVETTTNRGEFNRAYKRYLEHKKNGIHCSRCKYHRGENQTNKWYGGYKKTNGNWKLNYPNWKLVSKNQKQWMKKSINIIYNTRFDREYVEIKFST